MENLFHNKLPKKSSQFQLQLTALPKSTRLKDLIQLLQCYVPFKNIKLFAQENHNIAQVQFYKLHHLKKIAKKLKKIKFRGQKIKVELPPHSINICLHCFKMGHRIKDCWFFIEKNLPFLQFPPPLPTFRTETKDQEFTDLTQLYFSTDQPIEQDNIPDPMKQFSQKQTIEYQEREKVKDYTNDWPEKVQRNSAEQLLEFTFYHPEQEENLQFVRILPPNNQQLKLKESKTTYKQEYKQPVPEHQGKKSLIEDYWDQDGGIVTIRPSFLSSA